MPGPTTPLAIARPVFDTDVAGDRNQTDSEGGWSQNNRVFSKILGVPTWETDKIRTQVRAERVSAHRLREQYWHPKSTRCGVLQKRIWHCLEGYGRCGGDLVPPVPG